MAGAWLLASAICSFQSVASSHYHWVSFANFQKTENIQSTFQTQTVGLNISTCAAPSTMQGVPRGEFKTSGYQKHSEVVFLKANS